MDHPYSSGNKTGKNRNHNEYESWEIKSKIASRSRTRCSHSEQFQDSYLLMGHPQVRHPLVKMAPVRHVPFFSLPDPSEESHGGIQDEIGKGKNKNREGNRCCQGRHHGLHPVERPQKCASRISHEHPGRGPIMHEEPHRCRRNEKVRHRPSRLAITGEEQEEKRGGHGSPPPRKP